MLNAVFLVVAALAVTALSQEPGYPAILPFVTNDDNLTPILNDYGNANFFVDALLFKLNRQIPNVIYVGDVGGDMHLKNCSLLLKNGIKRDGDATLVTTPEDIRFNVALKMKNLGAFCNYRYTFFTGTFNGVSAEDAVASSYWLHRVSGQHPYITEFRVTTLTPVTSELTGVPGFNWLAEDIVDGNINAMGDEITYFIEVTLRDFLQGILDTMVIP